uniref:Uncharacterized protein n=1 Tax=Arundo donax TaxID=35708 RepID=A0A0A9AUN9_ARUDO
MYYYLQHRRYKKMIQHNLTEELELYKSSCNQRKTHSTTRVD